MREFYIKDCSDMMKRLGIFNKDYLLKMRGMNLQQLKQFQWELLRHIVFGWELDILSYFPSKPQQKAETDIEIRVAKKMVYSTKDILKTLRANKMRRKQRIEKILELI